MKTKKVLTKKLELTKSTVADLNNADQMKIHGGVIRTVIVTVCITNCLQCPSMKCM
jgi:hypothetical protein